MGLVLKFKRQGRRGIEGKVSGISELDLCQKGVCVTW